ncbi:hypothetical protein VNI00_007536 [Paramarasmius palmivorus]|uniref:F-box domain-containing protein n=1 Tax=Paramarasmius palmivorus TaxID=297713 RepID=A0AAW0D2D2_9AGAR
MANKEQLAEPSQSHSAIDTPSLLPEIIEKIVGQLGEDYDEEDLDALYALRNCAVVSSVVRPFAQARLFAEASIGNVKHCKMWNRKLNEAPHLVKHVRQLSLWGGHYEEDIDDEEIDLRLQQLRFYNGFSLGMNRPISKFLSSDAFSELTIKLTHLQKLSVHRFHFRNQREHAFSDRFPDVERLGLDVALGSKEQLQALVLQKRRVHELHIVHVKYRKLLPIFPPEVERFHEAGLELQAWNPQLPPIRLHRLRVDNLEEETHVLMWLTGPAFDLTGLRTLGLMWGTNEAGVDKVALTAFLGAVSPYVTDLNILSDGKYNGDSVSTALVESRLLDGFIALESLYIAAVHTRHSQWPHLASIAKIIPTLHASPLKVIMIGMFIDFDLSKNVQHLQSLQEWPTIDDSLSHTAFPSLRRVTILLKIQVITFYASRIHSKSCPTKEEIITAMRQALPKLFRRGLLNVEVTLLKPMTTVDVGTNVFRKEMAEEEWLDSGSEL